MDTEIFVEIRPLDGTWKEAKKLTDEVCEAYKKQQGRLHITVTHVMRDGQYRPQDEGERHQEEKKKESRQGIWLVVAVSVITTLLIEILTGWPLTHP